MAAANIRREVILQKRKEESTSSGYFQNILQKESLIPVKWLWFPALHEQNVSQQYLKLALVKWDSCVTCSSSNATPIRISTIYCSLVNIISSELEIAKLKHKKCWCRIMPLQVKKMLLSVLSLLLQPHHLHQLLWPKDLS